MCDACDYRWRPCGDQYCQGYRLRLDRAVPEIIGCPECDELNGGIRDTVARWWPGAWRAMARKLDELRDAPPSEPAVTHQPPDVIQGTSPRVTKG